MTEEGINWFSGQLQLELVLGLAIGVVSDVTGWFEKDFIIQGYRSKTPIIVPTEKYLKVQQHVMDQAILFAPLSWPMFVEPNNWTNEQRGGYYLSRLMKGKGLVRHGDPTLRQPDSVLSFINKLQQVPYTLNKFVYDVALELKERTPGR